MPTHTDFINTLGQEWMQRAILSAILIGTVCALIGVFVLLRGLVFLGEAIAHSAFAGAALGLLLGIDPLWTILLFGTSAAIGIGYVNEKEIMRNEVIVGVSFSFFMALAILFIGMMEVYSSSVNSILFGNILLISRENFIMLIGLSSLTLVTLFLIKKELYYMTFDLEMAKISGIPVRLLNYIFLIIVALTIDVSLKGIGAILVFAMVVTPAAAAYQMTFRLNRMMFLAASFGVFSALMGLIISYLLDLPSGSTIVMISTGIFVMCFLISPKHRAAKNILECEYCGQDLDELLECKDEDCPLRGQTPHLHDESGVFWVRPHNLPEEEEQPHSHPDI
ncbi:MAG: metal ABC transporter permease [Candidatus Hodarchaeota archaeon]